MNHDILGGQWKQLQGKVKSKWAKLTDDDMSLIGGKRDMLVGRLQERYGHAKDAAEREVDDFIGSIGDGSPEPDTASGVQRSSAEGETRIR